MFMSKCSVCDERGATFYHDESMYHMECYYECYHYGDYDEGYQCARREIDLGELDADNALMMFDIDPADSAFQYGYRRACIHEYERKMEKLYGETD